MKNFKIFLVETLIQLTILLSITQHHNKNNNQFEDLLKNSLSDFQKQNFLSLSKNSYKESSSKDDYLSEIIRVNQNRQNYQLYLNHPLTNCLRVTDKFLEYPELQTKNSFVCLIGNNANISLEDMDVIKNILLEQDIDVGVVDKAFTYDFYDPSTKFGKNLSEKDEIDYLLKNKPTIVFKSPKAIPDQEVIPDGYQKIIEEDTGEVFFIPIDNYTSKDIDSSQDKFVQNITGFNTNFNPVILERYASNKIEYNDEYFQDFFFTDSGSVKFDEEWLSSFMEPTPDINQNMMSSTFNNDIEDDIHYLTTRDEQQHQNDVNLNIMNNISEITSSADNSTYSKSIIEIIDTMLANTTTQNSSMSNTVESLISGNFIDNDEIYNQNNQNSSASIILSDSMDGSLLENQINFKEEITSDDALYGLIHNHTYLETNEDDGVYHPHSYKNKLKSMINATNKESKDEVLLTEYKIEYSLDSIVNSNVEVFTEMLKDPKLTQDQLNVMKDIRRRGKNKIAAKTCRKRKIDSIDNLKEDVDELKSKKVMLELERKKIEEQMKEFARKIDSIYKDMIGSSQNVDSNDPIKSYIENLMKQLNEKPGSDVKTSKHANKRK